MQEKPYVSYKHANLRCYEHLHVKMTCPQESSVYQPVWSGPRAPVMPALRATPCDKPRSTSAAAAFANLDTATLRAPPRSGLEA
jgi:hypothetical protein